jgi:hypothetical protein
MPDPSHEDPGAPLVAKAATRYRPMPFLSGVERNSRLARENLHRLCDTELGDDCEIRVADGLEDFAPALEHNVLPTPAILVLAPPQPMIIGNLRRLAKIRTVLRLGTGGAMR